jgi:hypothetical protein
VHAVLTRVEVAHDELRERGARGVEVSFAGVPAFENGVVEACLAAEVVGNQLLVEARSRCDGLDTCAGEALVGELDLGRVQQGGAAALGVPHALVACR